MAKPRHFQFLFSSLQPTQLENWRNTDKVKRNVTSEPSAPVPHLGQPTPHVPKVTLQHPPEAVQLSAQDIAEKAPALQMGERKGASPVEPKQAAALLPTDRRTQAAEVQAKRQSEKPTATPATARPKPQMAAKTPSTQNPMEQLFQRLEARFSPHGPAKALPKAQPSPPPAKETLAVFIERLEKKKQESGGSTASE